MDAVKHGSRYHPYQNYRPASEVLPKRQQNGFNVPYNNIQQTIGPNQSQTWNGRAPSPEIPVPKTKRCLTASSVTVTATQSVSAVGSFSIQTQSTVSESFVTNPLQELHRTSIESSLLQTKPNIENHDCSALSDKINSRQGISQADAINASRKSQSYNMHPATSYHIITLSPDINKSDIPNVVISSKENIDSYAVARKNNCSRPFIHARHPLPTASVKTALPAATNINHINLLSNQAPTQCISTESVPFVAHSYSRSPFLQKYKNKGIDAKNPILIESDDEDEHKNKALVPDDQPPESPLKKITVLPNPAAVTKNTADKGSSTRILTSLRKRAKMTAVLHSDTLPSSTSTVTTTEARQTTVTSTSTSKDIDFHGRSQLLERIFHDRENSTLSSSSDSISSFSSMGSFAPPTASVEESIEDSLDQLLRNARENKPFKKLRTTPKNLYTHTKNRNIGKVIALLAEGCNPNEQLPGEKGKTAMHAAAAAGHVGILKAFRRLVNGDFNVRDNEKRTPLFDAVEYNRMAVVEYLIDNDADLSIKDENGMTCLHVAARRGFTDLLTLLLSTSKFNVNEKDSGGWTAVMWAADEKHIDATRCLAENGANIHLRDEEQNVPLHWAAQAGCLEIVDLLLRKGSDIHSVNLRGDTALHLAARENNLSCVRLFLDRGAKLDILNKNKESALNYCVEKSSVYKLLRAKQELSACQGKRRKFRLLCSDISRGQEKIAIPCVNEVDDDPYPNDFHFVKESVETNNTVINRNISRLEFCDCTDSCKTTTCSCAALNENKRIWYTEDGRLINEIHRFDRPLVYECNRMCKCWSHCRNRLVQHGIQVPLQMFKTENRGWGVRAFSDITKGSYICEYIGELISDEEAETIEDDSYLFDLDCKENDELYCINAKKYGNISRFINHSCKPNVVPVRVFIDHQDIRFPRICFFASIDIKKDEEVCSDYGVKFWEVKRNVLFCTCGSENCQYGKIKLE